MRRLIRYLRRLCILDGGPTTVEYAFMLALIIVVAMFSIRILGSQSDSTFNGVAEQMEADGSGGGSVVGEGTDDGKVKGKGKAKGKGKGKGK